MKTINIPCPYNTYFSAAIVRPAFSGLETKFELIRAKR